MAETCTSLNRFTGFRQNSTATITTKNNAYTDNKEINKTIQNVEQKQTNHTFYSITFQIVVTGKGFNQFIIC